MTLEQILARMTEIRSLLESDQEVDLTALDTELRELNDKKVKLKLVNAF